MAAHPIPDRFFKTAAGALALVDALRLIIASSFRIDKARQSQVSLAPFQ